MLHIYYARENVNKEAFAFEKIYQVITAEGTVNPHAGVLVLVPDQYKLQAERAAMKYMQMPGLMGIEIMSLRRLGNRILEETGGERCDYINKYGRHIIISDILEKNAAKLPLYGGFSKRSSFIELANNIISEFKRFGITPEALSLLIDERQEENTNALLMAKLKEILFIYSQYEKAISGKYVDTEDRVNLFLGRIADCSLVKGREIWMWGFDWLAPKDIDTLRELMTLGELNVLFTCDADFGNGRAGGHSLDGQLFTLTKDMMDKLIQVAESAGVEYSLSQIDDKYSNKERSAAITGIERALFTMPLQPATEAELQSATGADPMVRLVTAASFHSEAETAAAYILDLVREKGYRLKEIALLCNDHDVRGEIIRQVFEEYGLDVYMDRRRSIMRHPAIAFLMSLISIVSSGYRSEDIFSMLKTGYGPLSHDETELLENYAIAYKIRGKRWKEGFTKIDDYAQITLDEIESLRQRTIDFIAAFEAEYRADKSAQARSEAIYSYLRDVVDMPAKLQDEIQTLEAEGNLEEAGELAHIWQSLLEVLHQMQTVMGDEKVGMERYKTILEAGINAVEIGMLPPGADGLIMGTMQRTRLSEETKALVILGANEGLIPSSGSTMGLLSDAEKVILSAGDHPVAKLGDLRNREEMLAIYRILSSARERVYMSCSLSGAQGEKLRPAEIFNDLKMFYGITPELDIVSAGDPVNMIHSPVETVHHLARAAEEARRRGVALDAAWQEAYTWCRDNAAEETSAMLEGIRYNNRQGRLPRELARMIYRNENGVLRVSPSSFENYSRCPFKFFVQTGLNPSERRLYEMNIREIGDIYHECLEELMGLLSSDGLLVRDPASKWQTLSRAEADALCDKVFEKHISTYRRGLAKESEEEIYRSERMKQVLRENAWALILHVRRGRVDRVELERSFSDHDGSDYPAITINEGTEDEVKITGRIDRVDTLQGGEIKIIDYKSGLNKISPDLIRSGWKLQLMLYLKAASCNNQAPAGIFYYHINLSPASKDEKTLANINEELQKDLDAFNINSRSNYRMEGLIVDDKEILRSVAGEGETNSRNAFNVITGCTYGYLKDEQGNNIDDEPVYKGDALISKEDFETLRKDFDRLIANLCTKLSEGHIDILPARRQEDGETGCKYCEYHGICHFDTALKGCFYRNV